MIFFLFAFQGFFPDKATERKILSFAIKCPSEDCEWTGELRSKEVKSLLYLHCSALSCRCWSTFHFRFDCTKESFFFHLGIQTELSTLAYKYTETAEAHTFFVCVYQVHLASCLFKLVHCTNENCHMTIQRRELEEHVTINCTWRILACDHCSEQHPECNMKVKYDLI